MLTRTRYRIRYPIMLFYIATAWRQTDSIETVSLQYFLSNLVTESLPKLAWPLSNYFLFVSANLYKVLVFYIQLLRCIHQDQYTDPELIWLTSWSWSSFYFDSLPLPYDDHWREAATISLKNTTNLPYLQEERSLVNHPTSTISSWVADADRTKR